MAHITANSPASMLKIKHFLGLNENQDGDTHIDSGEFSRLLNFRITPDKHLRIRPGQKLLADLHSLAAPGASPVCYGVWSGTANAQEYTLIAFGGKVFALTLTSSSALTNSPSDTSCTTSANPCPPEIRLTELGWLPEPYGPVTFFGFENQVYLLTHNCYQSWSGDLSSPFSDVIGYIPTILTAASPNGNGTSLENINRLNSLRRVRFSPDGFSTVFRLPEQNLTNILSVSDSSGIVIPFTSDLQNGLVSFSSPPAAGVNTLSVTYQASHDAREEVYHMRFAELYNGSTDTRVFLYGDGSNRAIYSGIHLDTGLPSADYFPDLYEARVGDENTPLTSMIRHYSRLLAFKPGSAWALDYNTALTDLNSAIPVFYVTPLNRQIGNTAPGQVRLLENDPLTLENASVYQWSGTYPLTNDNRNAKRISDRVRATLSTFDFNHTYTFNRSQDKEFWFLCQNSALILNYAVNVWYAYSNMPFMALSEIHADNQPDNYTILLGFTADGRVFHISDACRSDNGSDIDAYAETGSIDFDRDWLRKYSPELFVAMKPENGGRITLSVQTDQRSYPDTLISAGYMGFNHVDFSHFSFSTNHKPRVKRVKLRVKKAAFYKLIFKSCSSSAAATILETDIHLRYTGNIKSL